LRIGCTSDIAKTLLTPNLNEFLDKYQEIDVRVRVGERLLPEPNILDVVLHCGWLSDSRLTARKIAEVKNILVASQEYIQANGMPTSPDDLENHAIIGNFYLDAAAIEPGPLPTYRRFLSTDHSQILELVKNGRVIAPITGILALPGLLSGELVRILPDYEISESPQLYALYLDRLASIPKLKIFLYFIEQVVKRLTKEWQPLADKLFPKQNLTLFPSINLQTRNNS
jgi:DNA-binding transcriptional LysR family regulator